VVASIFRFIAKFTKVNAVKSRNPSLSRKKKWLKQDFFFWFRPRAVTVEEDTALGQRVLCWYVYDQQGLLFSVIICCLVATVFCFLCGGALNMFWRSNVLHADCAGMRCNICVFVYCLCSVAIYVIYLCRYCDICLCLLGQIFC